MNYIHRFTDVRLSGYLSAVDVDHPARTIWGTLPDLRLLVHVGELLVDVDSTNSTRVSVTDLRVSARPRGVSVGTSAARRSSRSLLIRILQGRSDQIFIYLPTLDDYRLMPVELI